MNLKKDKWIPILKNDGSTVNTNIDNVDSPDFLMVNFPREDLNVSTTLFLISCYQTFSCPKTERDWKRGLKKAPRLNMDPKQFELRDFMQRKLDGKEKRIQHLFFNSPSQDAVENHHLFFDKDGEIKKICLPCVAAALFFYQSHANAGGRDNYTSVRGGSPMTSLIIGKNLWETVWLNVIPKDRLPKIGTSKGNILPWTRPIGSITSDRANIFHSLWGMPRKVQLGKVEESVCDVCGNTGHTISSFIEKRAGIQYANPNKDNSPEKPAKPWFPWFLNFSPLEDKGKKRGFEAKKCWAFLTIEKLTELLTAPHPYVNSLYNYIENRMSISASIWFSGYISKGGKQIEGWLNQMVSIPKNIVLARELIDKAIEWYEPVSSKLMLVGVNRNHFFNQLKDLFFEITNNNGSVEQWDNFIKGMIQGHVQKLIPNWSFEDQKPAKKPKEKKEGKSIKRFDKDESFVIRSWYGKLQKKPGILKEIKLSNSLEDISRMRNTVVLSERLGGTLNPELVAIIAKVLAHVRNNSREKFSTYNLTKERREKLRTGSWNEILNHVDGQSIDVVNIAEIVRNWNIIKETIK